MVGWLGAQGTSGAQTVLCQGCEGATATAKLNGAAVVATEKTEEEKRRTAAMPWL